MSSGKSFSLEESKSVWKSLKFVVQERIKLVWVGTGRAEQTFEEVEAMVMRGSVVKCLTHNPGVQGLSRIGYLWFLVGVSMGKTLQSPSLVLMKPRKDMNNVI